MLAVTAYPIVYAVWLSLQRYNLAAPDDTSSSGSTTTSDDPHRPVLVDGVRR